MMRPETRAAEVEAAHVSVTRRQLASAPLIKRVEKSLLHGPRQGKGQSLAPKL